MKRKNLWAPWRVKYIQGLSQESLCDYYSAPQKDKENLLLWRTEHAFVVFNKFPYNNGHLLIAPVRHIASLDDASDDELMGLMGLVRDCQKALSLTIKPHGFNVGMNFGRCAGAGLPDHLHIHVVPRWNGDTNYMHVCSGTDVISQGLYELYDQLVEVSQTENLPRV
ncbi:MAG: HIT family protein [Planctomycetota bacterium]